MDNVQNHGRNIFYFGSASLHSPLLCSIHESVYQFVEYSGEDVHERARLFSLFGQGFSNCMKDTCISLVSVRVCSCVVLL